MPDQSDLHDTDGEQTEDNLVTLKRSQIKSIERKAKERDDFASQLEQAQRRLAFAEAGIPLGDKRMGFFIKGYDGEMTPDAIREAAIENGFLDEGQTGEPGQTTVDGQVERQVVENVFSASTGAGTQNPDGMSALYDAFEKGGADAVIKLMAETGNLAQG